MTLGKINITYFSSHLQMNYSKSFQRSNVDCLETPEHITTMLVPGNSIFSLYFKSLLFPYVLLPNHYLLLL